MEAVANALLPAIQMVSNDYLFLERTSGISFLGCSERGMLIAGGLFSITAAQTSTHAQPLAIRGPSRRRERTLTAGDRRGQPVLPPRPDCYNDRHAYPQSIGPLHD
jgi:hypothetical protein